MGQLAKGVKAKGGGEWGRALLIGLFLLLRWVLFLLFRVVPRQGTGEGLRRIIVVASEGGPLLVFTHHAVTDIVLKMQMGLTDGIRQTASGQRRRSDSGWCPHHSVRVSAGPVRHSRTGGGQYVIHQFKT